MNANAHHRPSACHRSPLAAVLALAVLLAFAAGATASTAESAAYGQQVDLKLTWIKGSTTPVVSGPAPLAAGLAPDGYDVETGVGSTLVSLPLGLGNVLSTGAIVAGARSAVPELDDAEAGVTVDSALLRLGTQLTLTAGRITAGVEVVSEDGESCWSGTEDSLGVSLERGTLGGSLVPVPIGLPASPEANHVALDLPGVVTVVLNEQVIDEAGLVRVHAVHVLVHGVVLPGLGTLRGDIYLGHAEASLACGGADVAVSIVETVDPATVGQPITYTAQVTNRGPERALDPLLSLPFTAAVTPVSATPSRGTCAIAGGSIICSFGDIRAGQTATVTFVVTPVHSGAVAIPADVAAANGDFFPEDNHACEITMVNGTTGLKGAHLKIEVEESADPVRVGQLLTYDVTIGHQGGAAVPAALAAFELPFGMWLESVVPAQGSCTGDRLIVCELGPMAAGQQVPVTVTVRVMRGGLLKAAGVVSSSLVDPQIDDNCREEETVVEDPSA